MAACKRKVQAEHCNFEILCYLVRVPDPSLLLLIPAYNEERRIEPVLRDYARFFQEQYPGKFQIVVVLNGCTDNTLGVVQKVATEFSSVSCAEFSRNPSARAARSSKASSSRRTRDLIGYVDADGATPPHAFLDLVRHIERGGLRHRLALAAGCGHSPVADRPPAIRQPRVSSHRATACSG